MPFLLVNVKRWMSLPSVYFPFNSLVTLKPLLSEAAQIETNRINAASRAVVFAMLIVSPSQKNYYIVNKFPFTEIYGYNICFGVITSSGTIALG